MGNVLAVNGMTPKIADDVFIAPNAVVVGNVTIGAGSSVWYGAVIRGDSGKITIGERTSVQDNVVVHVNDRDDTVIGNDVTIGHGAVLEGCLVEDFVLIGMNSTVLSGSHIGRFAVVGAGAVVPENKTIPPKKIALGIPAKVRGDVSGELFERVKNAPAKYLKYASWHQETVEISAEFNEQAYQQSRWATYYKRFKGRLPRPMVLNAIDLLADSHDRVEAVDLGCGAGIDTLAMLDAGWRVLATDAQEQALTMLKENALPRFQDLLTIRLAKFEDVVIPACDIVYAAYSLPFCHPDAFDGLWEQIVRAIRPNGLFVGQLFGDRDGWSFRDNMTFHSEAEMAARFTEFDLISVDIRDEMGTTANGKEKYWHVFSVTARKK